MDLNIKSKSVAKLLSIVLVTVAVSCQPDEFKEGNGLTATDLDAGFIISPVTDANNTYLLTGNSSYITSSWDLGTGAGFSLYGNEGEVFFPDAGTYTIQHKVTGIGGVSATVSQNLEVETSDPIAGNIVKGGKFDTAEDIDHWNIVNISASGTEWTFVDGKAKVQGGNWNQKGLYQAIEVIEGLTYKIDMLVSSTSGVTDTWFEVFASPTTPVDGSDYSAGGKLITINTWAGCGGAPFSGKLSDVGCDLNALTYPGEPGKFVAETTGTIYLVIKSGGADLGDGISIDNIEMRALN
jgi:hypothetical protein